ncbi:MAG TPA: ATP-binding cassette domain-containing protein [Erysipelothrix sp.]|nr:ATP-binding cassette domain-containing protein [Erysipelothrix sp.]
MILEFNQINKYFDDFHVLKDVSFKVKSGQIFGYLGRNGAGKTTSIRILMDVFKQNSGEILLDNQTFNHESFTIGYLPEERGMYSKTKVQDQLVYFSMLRGANKKEALASVLYWTKRFDIEEYLNRPLETLSKGNQQKVQITQAFLNEPDILILDEPFSGLDPVNSKIFQDALQEYISDDKIIIFSSHQMSYVESFCDDIAIIDHGKIILDGNLQTIKKEMGGSNKVIEVKYDNFEEVLESLKLEYFKQDSAFVVNLTEELTSKDFIKALVKEDVEILSYKDFTPSLQEIFIRKVGEEK